MATRLPHPWDEPPGKNTGMGCHFLLQFPRMHRPKDILLSFRGWNLAFFFLDLDPLPAHSLHARPGLNKDSEGCSPSMHIKCSPGTTGWG